MSFLKKTLSFGGNKMSKSYPSTSGKCFLHGTLDIEILEAKNLPDMEGKN